MLILSEHLKGNAFLLSDTGIDCPKCGDAVEMLETCMDTVLRNLLYLALLKQGITPGDVSRCLPTMKITEIV